MPGHLERAAGLARVRLHRLPTERTETSRPRSTMFNLTRNASSLRNAAVALLLAVPLSACMVGPDYRRPDLDRSEEHTSELQSPDHLVCPLLLEKKKKIL